MLKFINIGVDCEGSSILWVAVVGCGLARLSCWFGFWGARGLVPGMGFREFKFSASYSSVFELILKTMPVVVKFS